MITAAVICEYNPFHKGHEYQLKTIRQQLNADRIICLMSGDYVQRGEPAILSKEIRTRMALEGGADLVLLLPVSFATAAADIFAYGAVSILNRLGVVDYLCFGAECDSLEELQAVHQSICTRCSVESPQMQEMLKAGYTYAGARSELLPEYSQILNGSNNVLALEYLNALEKTDSKMQPFLIKRIGQGYNDESINKNVEYQSASGIRKIIKNGSLTDVVKWMPAGSTASFTEEQLVFPSDYDDILLHALLFCDNLSDYSDCSKDLANRIAKNLCYYSGYEAFAESLKTKNYTRVRINRALLHIFLNIKGTNSELKDLADNLSCVRLLGFSRKSAGLLSDISSFGTIKVISKVPDVYNSLSDTDRAILDLEEKVSRLYDSVLTLKNGQITVPEYSKGLIIIQ